MVCARLGGYVGPTGGDMERVITVHRDHASAAAAERAEYHAMTPEQRMLIARELQLRVYGRDCPDVREAERLAGRWTPPPR
jgi:hypothetical protein